MTVLLSRQIDRTLTHWLHSLPQQAPAGSQWELWLFEGLAARQAAERQLRQQGVTARIRSAYKPLVHFFLEEVEDLDQLAQVQVRYPVQPEAPANRFRLETYPLAAMLPQAELHLMPGDTAPRYQVQLQWRDGRQRSASVPVPCRPVSDAWGGKAVASCGWVRQLQADGNEVRSEALDTDYAQAFETAMQAVQQHPWPQAEPYFGRLLLRIDLPGFEQAIAGTGETMSTAEALHEELYFGLLAHFQHHSGRPAGDRRLQPGQMVPDIRCADDADPLALQHIQVLVETQALQTAGDEPHDTLTADHAARALAHVAQAPSIAEVQGFFSPLVQQHGLLWQGRSRQGRAVGATYQVGSDRPVLISGGQHANETSGVVGALRAGLALAEEPASHFALLPLENPDGYALHQWYCRQAPQHMHHAARYSALGDDIEYRETEPLYERVVRQDALAGSGAQLHINLHGYPAHEWVHPLTGYIPRGFDLWTLPKGFFLILRYHAGWQAQAEQLAEAVTQALLQVPGLAEYNARQLALYQQHSGLQPFSLLHGTPYTMAENHASPAAMTLITEFPDETVTGDAFVFAHQAQLAATLVAYRAWQHIALP
ncbi:M14 family metallopeptidase [Comamonas humi]